MQWFTACMVFAVQNLDADRNKWFEETWVMVPAISEKEALISIEFYGNSQNETFMNSHGERIFWEYLGHRHLQASASDSEIIEIVSLEKKHPGFYHKNSREVVYSGL